MEDVVLKDLSKYKNNNSSKCNTDKPHQKRSLDCLVTEDLHPKSSSDYSAQSHHDVELTFGDPVLLAVCAPLIYSEHHQGHDINHDNIDNNNSLHTATIHKSDNESIEFV